MIGYGIDRGGPKDSENAPNSFLTKINEKVFWRFATDMLCKDWCSAQGLWEGRPNSSSEFCKLIISFLIPINLTTKVSSVKSHESKKKGKNPKMNNLRHFVRTQLMKIF